MNEQMTVSCGNVFEDMGFASDEAAVMLVRETLLVELEKTMSARGRKQQELAEELSIFRTRISEIIKPSN